MSKAASEKEGGSERDREGEGTKQNFCQKGKQATLHACGAGGNTGSPGSGPGLNIFQAFPIGSFARFLPDRPCSAGLKSLFWADLGIL